MMQLHLARWIAFFILIAGTGTLVPALNRVTQPILPETSTTEPAAQDASATRNDLKATLDFRPFGNATVGGAQSAGATNANGAMTLQGVVLGATPDRSVALISMGSARPEAISPGGALLNGMTVDTITAEEVTLVRDGTSIILHFPEPEKRAVVADPNANLFAPVLEGSGLNNPLPSGTPASGSANADVSQEIAPAVVAARTTSP